LLLPKENGFSNNSLSAVMVKKLLTSVMTKHFCGGTDISGMLKGGNHIVNFPS
jgi:hypothetical protein